MDSRIRSRAYNGPGIGGIHNGVHTHIGYIVSDNGKGHWRTSFFYNYKANSLIRQQKQKRVAFATRFLEILPMGIAMGASALAMTDYYTLAWPWAQITSTT